MNYMKLIFKNIEKLYEDNKEQLLVEDGLRPAKSTTRDTISAVGKFKQFFSESDTYEVTRGDIASHICNDKELDNDVVRTHIKEMIVLNFLEKTGKNEFVFTDTFKRFVESKNTIGSYIIEGMKNISSINDINMIYNAFLSVLREGYLNGRILIFPESLKDFRNEVPKEQERIEYCEMIYDIYGFNSRNKNPSLADYTPNISYRFVSTMKDLGLIDKLPRMYTGLPAYGITEKGIDVLKEIECNLNEHILIDTNNDIDHSHNRIIFGAPGTGKSYRLDEDSRVFNHENFERVTFHPSYSYSQFVGTYKPRPLKVGGTEITYEYVPGPFLKIWQKAYKSQRDDIDPKNYLIIIEEINRANVASVFGDIFQLLDRKDGESEYDITTSEDMNQYLAKDTNETLQEYKKIKLPKNLYIWATMNSADQGVFPIDTAFKRRWSFEYLDIDSGEDQIENIIIKLGEKQENIKWNKLRHEINEKLINLKINEDKLIGPFFLSLEELTNENNFNKVFKSKLLMYLYEDVLRHKKAEFFKEGLNTYSNLIKHYDKNGGDIFDFKLEYLIAEDETQSDMDSDDDSSSDQVED